MNTNWQLGFFIEENHYNRSYYRDFNAIYSKITSNHEKSNQMGKIGETGDKKELEQPQIVYAFSNANHGVLAACL